MFKFNRDDLKIEFVQLKSISKATIDPRMSFIDSNGVLQKVSVPVSVARIVRARLKNVNRFPSGYPACVAVVAGRVVALDVATGVSYKLWKETGDWISQIETNIGIMDTLEGDWLWDGQYAYREVGDVVQMADTNFGSQQCRVFNTFRLSEEKAALFEDLAALCYKNPLTGAWIKTSPVTRTSGGFLQITGDVSSFNKNDIFADSDAAFKKIDGQVFPNIRFVTYAAKVLANQFGYDSIEPLGLPSLMIEHQTFNIGGLPTEVQAASPAPMKFTAAVAWNIGLMRKVHTLDDLIAVKSTLKMLLTKGNTQEKMNLNKQEVSTQSRISDLRKAAAAMPLISYEPTEL